MPLRRSGIPDQALILGAALAALGTTAAWADAPAWKPDLAVIARLERKLVLPPYSHILGHYQRYYAGDTVGGRRVVEGRLIWSRRAITHIVAPDKLPNTKGGGCDYIDLTYDVQDDKVTSVACHAWD